MKRKTAFPVFICLLILSYSKVNAQCSDPEPNVAACSTPWGGGGSGQTYYITPGIPVNLRANFIVNWPANEWGGVGAEVDCGSFWWVASTMTLGSSTQTNTIPASFNTGTLGLWVSAPMDSYGEIVATW